MRPEFSEKEFEFCFNAEFMRKNSSVVIGIPHLPNQRLEGLYGFDVEFRVNQGDIQYSLFLQHKVSNFVNRRGGRYWYIYNFHRGPYYYFRLKRLGRSPQHNLLHNLRQTGEEVYYSAPLFFERSVFIQHFVNNVVIDNSVFIDPFSIGLITDLDLHRISYDQNASQATFHSELNNIATPYNFKVLIEKLERRKIDELYFSKLFATLERGLSKVFHTELRLPERYLELPYVSRCAYLLRKYYKLQWIMF